MASRQLGATHGEVAVESLAWDGLRQVLYIGGHFNQIHGVAVPSGLAMWNRTTGLRPFPGGGLGLTNKDGPSNETHRR